MEDIFFERLEDNLNRSEAIDEVFKMDDFVQAITSPTPNTVTGSDTCVVDNPVPEMLKVFFLFNFFFICLPICSILGRNFNLQKNKMKKMNKLRWLRKESTGVHQRKEKKKTKT